MPEIEEWLTQLQLEKYIDAFKDAEIDYDTLADLQEEDLKEINLPLGPRRKIWGAINRLRTPAPQETAALQVPAQAMPPAQNDSDTGNEAERRHLTVMFVDLVGSTELSTRVDAEEVREVITGFQNTVAGIIGRFEGFVARFMGDGVLCYFGWPRANEDDAERAVRAGLSIIENVRNTNTPDGTPLSTRIGIASGLVIVGDLIGSGASEEAAVVGETPNLAARLQSLAGPDQLVLPNATRKLLNNVFTMEANGSHALKGIAEPVEAFVVTGEALQESRFETRNSDTMTALVGRSQELGLIREGWAHAVEGGGQMIVVSGEAGIGKSRIVQAAIEEVKQIGGHTRITFQCSPYHTESAFYPITNQMQFAAGITAADNGVVRLRKLEALAGVLPDNIPLLATLLGIDPESGYTAPKLTPAQLRTLTMEALADTLVQQANHSPVLVVFEDLHWIDPTTLEFLDLAIDAIESHRIFVLATARPTFDHGFGGHPGVRQFTLNRLGREQVFSIVRKLTNGKPIPEEVQQIILERTDGIPLFVEELTKTVLESQVLKELANEFVLDGPLDRLAIPHTLHDSLMSRLDKLQPIKEVAQTASCIGREFPYHLLSQVSALLEAQLQSALDGLVGAELIYRRGVSTDARYQFKHALVRDTAYDSLLKPRRRTIHSAILQALETDPDVSQEVLATHAEAAELIDRAIDLWAAASKAAIARPAYDEGIAHLNRAIKLIAPQVEAGDIAAANKAVALQLQLAVATVARRGIGAQATKDAFKKAMELADLVGETPLRFGILYGLMMVRYLRGDNEEAVRHGESFVELAEQAPETAPAVVANRSFGVALMNVGQLERAQHYYDRALELFDPDSHKGLAQQYAQDLGMGSNGFISFNLSLRGQSQRSEQLFRDCEFFGSTCGDINSACYVHLIGILNAVLARDDAQLARHSGEIGRLSVEQNLFLWKSLGAMGDGLLRAASGDEAGIEDYRKADNDLVASGSMMCLPILRIEASRRAFALGRRDWADQLIESAKMQIENTAESNALSDLHRLEAELALADGKPDAADACLQNALDVARMQGAKRWEIRAAIDYAKLKTGQQQPAEALSVLQPVYDAFADGDCSQERDAAERLLTGLSEA